MGVLACDRNGCHHIMCQYVSNSYGYLCEYCFEELKSKPNADIYEFMNSEPTPEESNYLWTTFIESEFKDRYCEDFDE